MSTLIVSEKTSLCFFIKELLSGCLDEYDVLEANSLESVQEIIEKNRPELVLIDSNHPKSGLILDLCEKSSSVYFAVLLSDNHTLAINQLYVTKPSSDGKGVGAFLGYLKGLKMGVEVSVGRWHLSVLQKTLSNGAEVNSKLSENETRLIYELMSHPERSCSSDLLNAKVWGTTQGIDSSTLRQLIGKLRKKFGENFILTDHGHGYRFGR